MTGLELKMLLLLIFITAVLPGLLISVLRSFLSCAKKTDQQGGYIQGFFYWLWVSVILFIIILATEWDNSLTIDYMLGLTTPKAVFASCQAALIIIFTKFWDLFIPSKDESICWSGYAIAMVISGLTMAYLSNFSQ